MTGISLDRRTVLTGLGAAAAMTGLSPAALGQTKANLVVIGGGFGGATAAKFLKLFLPSSSVTLIEPNET